MRDQWRGLKLLVTTAFRVDPWRSAGSLLEPIGRAGHSLLGFWIALLTNGVLQHRDDLLIAGVAGILGGTLAFWVFGLIGNDMRLILSEKAGFAFDKEIARLTSKLPGLDHLERSDYHDRLELLRQQQGVLGNSMNSLLNTINAVLVGIVILVMMVSIHPLLLLLGLLALPSGWLVGLRQRWIKQADEEAASSSRLARHLRRLAYDRNAGMEVRVFELQDEIGDRAWHAWDDARRPVLRAQRKVILTTTLQEAVYIAGLVLGIGFVLWQAFNGEASAGDVVLAIYICRQVQAAVLWPINSLGNLGRVLIAAGRLLWLQDYASSQEAQRTGDQPAPSRLSEGVVFDNVSFRYPGTSEWVLRDVSLTIPAGGVVALVGENGAGKTTLVKLLTRMYEPTSGRILVDGVDLATIEVTEWRSKLSAAFQDFARLELRAVRSVGVGELSSLDNESAVEGALTRAGAADVVGKLPLGLSTQLGSTWDDGVDLSTGQWQKLALGRALMRTDSLVVFFDEPTASLDAPTEHELFERYASASRAGAENGMITVLVSHRFSTVRTADQIIVVADHSVAEHGSHEELMEAGGLYAELYSMQAKSYA